MKFSENDVLTNDKAHLYLFEMHFLGATMKRKLEIQKKVCKKLWEKKTETTSKYRKNRELEITKSLQLLQNL